VLLTYNQAGHEVQQAESYKEQEWQRIWHLLDKGLGGIKATDYAS
jgi:hypothetical protein